MSADRQDLRSGSVVLAGWWRASAMGMLVSVVIPCYNHARFLGEAIESVLGQTYRPVEAVVVDDGSTDDSARVAARYAGVRCLRQANRGIAAARNAGFRASSGDYVVFLDADDRLLPCAVEAGVAALEGAPDAVFAVGRHRRIDAVGRPLPLPRRQDVGHDHYVSLVRRCWITVPTVTYRRAVLERDGPFDETLPCAEDYDLYLKIARHHPIVEHETEVAEYRQHGAMVTRDAGRMLAWTLVVLRRHRPPAGATATHRAAYRAREHAVWFYERLLEGALDDLAQGRLRAALLQFLRFARYLPHHPRYALWRLATPLRLAARALRG